MAEVKLDNHDAEVKVKHRYAEAWDESDIVLVVEDTELHVHYQILKFNSPVFSAMFSSKFIEAKERRVELPGKEIKYFIVFLDLLYPLSPGYDVTTDMEVLEKVLKYADEYQVNVVKLHVDSAIAMKIYAHADVIQDKMLETYVPYIPNVPYVPYVPTTVTTSYRITQGKLNAINTTRSALRHLRMSDTYGLKESVKFILSYLISEDSCTSYQGTIFNQLSWKMKYELMKGKMCKYYRHAKFVTGEPNSITLQGMRKAETHFKLLQDITEMT